MSAEAFQRWLAEMREAGLARSGAACARLLGMSEDWITFAKANGTDRRTALACRALLHRMEPYQ